MKFDLVNYIIAQNLPFNISQDLIKFIQWILQKYDSNTVLQSKIYPSQVSFIAKECIANTFKEDIFSHLRISPFSISVDEGSDKFGSAYLAVSVRYFATVNSISPQTKLLGVLEMGSSAKGEVLYGKINQLIFSGPFVDKIKQNFMGICSDHASNMISGGEKGLSNRLRQDFPYIFVTHDYCHSYNLILKEGISSFPSEIIAIINDTCNHFANSPQRKSRFREFQKSLGMDKPLEVLKLVKTRWLSYRDCLDRILALENPLRLYFEEYGDKKQKEYFSETNVVYLKVLACLVNKIGHYIEYFEHEDLTNEAIVRTIRESVILVSDLILELPDIEMTTVAQLKRFEEIATINLNEEENGVSNSNFRSLEDFAVKFIHEYSHIEGDLTKLNPDNQQKIIEAAKDFTGNALIKMKKWLPIKEKALFDSENISLNLLITDFPNFG